MAQTDPTPTKPAIKAVLTADEAFSEELEALKLRRESRGQPTKDIGHQLVGLAFSGGGIRSATFGLGVLEALKQRGLLEQVDYLSTVSGGGYIGAWLTANCRRAAQRKAAIAANKIPDRIQEDPEAKRNYIEAAKDWLHKDTSWAKSIAHLRRYSNYLSPQLGIFSADAWSMAAIWLRNTMLVQLTVMLAIAAILLAPRLIFVGFLAWPTLEDWRWLSVLLFVLAVTGIAANLWQVSSNNPVPFLDRKHWKRGLAGALVCILLTAALCLSLPFNPFSDQPINSAAALLVALLVVMSGLYLLPLGMLPAAPLITLANRLMPKWCGSDKPERINYGQGWTQSLIVVPIMITAIMFSAVLWGLTTGAHGWNELMEVDSFSCFFLIAWHYWPFPLAIAFISLWLLSAFSWRYQRVRKTPDWGKSWTKLWPGFGRLAYWRSFGAALLAPIPAVVALHALLCLIMLLMHGWAHPEYGPAEHGQWQAFVWGPALVLYSFSLAIVVLIGMMGRKTTEGVREWWARLGAWFLIYGVAWMIVTIAAVYGPLWSAMLMGSGEWGGWPVAGGWALTTLGGLMAGKSETTGRQKHQPQQASTGAKLKNLAALVGPYIFIAGLLVGIGSVVHLLLNYLAPSHVDGCCSAQQMQVQHWSLMSQPGLDLALLAVVFGALLCIVVLLALRVDINIFSLNAFYRGRLVRCYLGASRFVPLERKPQKFTQFDDDDEMDMKDPDWQSGQQTRPTLKQPGPLHIVNCALNLGGSSDLSLHTRHAASFTLTPYTVGSGYIGHVNGKETQMGYRRINQYYHPPAQPKLGHAIAVSGAAASPNMGYHTSTAVAFLLTLFNVRLGSWFPHPGKDYIAAPAPWLSLRYLVKELFGGADSRSNYLMISDGGHFENLAAYELVRRRCRLIIISDAECDPKLNFEGLGALIRMCEVDFGAVISLDVSSIIGDLDSEWSPMRYAVGSIHYEGSQPDGVLIYLKASMTSKEDSAILQYKACHSLFPHESTGDQFYGEDQFESYRHLGKDIATSVLETLNMKHGLIKAAEGLRNAPPRWQRKVESRR
jgi:hypothetical protein